MRTIAPVALGLTLILGLIAWRSWEHRGAAPPPVSRPPTLAAPGPPPAPDPGPDLALIGARVLTPRRLALWKAIGALRSGKGSADDDALSVLEQDLHLEIAVRAFGLHPAPADLEATLRRLARDAKDAATLARIEALFDGDHRAFLEEFVAPAFVETELWTRFRDDPEIHREARAAAEDLASRALRNPRQFQTLGSSEQTFGRSSMVPGAPADALPIDPGTLARLSTGQIYPSVLATAEAFVVVRVGRRRADFVELETWTIPKAAYATWLTERARKIDRTIFSPALRARVGALDPAQWLRQAFP